MDKKWEDCPREDLNSIPKMIAAGFEPEFSYADKRHGRATPEFVPHDAVSFKRGTLHVWKTYKRTDEGIFSAWTAADLIDGSYCNHRKYDELDEVIKKEVSK